MSLCKCIKEHLTKCIVSICFFPPLSSMLSSWLWNVAMGQRQSASDSMFEIDSAVSIWRLIQHFLSTAIKDKRQNHMVHFGGQEQNNVCVLMACYIFPMSDSARHREDHHHLLLLSIWHDWCHCKSLLTAYIYCLSILCYKQWQLFTEQSACVCFHHIVGT